jgi:antirestriction protein ArdC
MAGRRTRKLTPAEREARRRRDRERLAEATRELLSSDGWARWLRARATLHSYSLHNTLLIAQECHRRGFMPTYVAGFKTWLKLGRCVRKGERGISILAPLRVRDRDEDAEEDGKQRLLFRAVHVFDVSQTEPLPGVEPTPLGPPRAPVEGDSHAHLLVPLELLAGELGYTVVYREIGAADGLCEFGRRRISVGESLAPNAKVATLIHELAHALVGQRSGLARVVEEVVVEAVAYIGCASAGLDTGCDSVPYIAAHGDEEALATLTDAAELIDALARRIEQALSAEDQQAEQLDAA